MVLLKLGTRRSLLALTQARLVADQLMNAFPETQVEIVPMTTSGDQRSAAKSEGEDATENLKALFTKELEDALLDKRVDLVVHSLKDVAAEIPKGLTLGAFPEREDPRDVWISKTALPFNQLPKGARIATGAVRRQAQLRHVYPDAVCVALRGNVDTRLRKLTEENLDGLILALAGLKRLGRAAEATEILSPEIFLPAVGQGALVIQVRENDTRLKPYLEKLDHAPTRHAVISERAFLAALGGDCQTPIAAYATLEKDSLLLRGAVFSLDGKEKLSQALQGPTTNAAKMGEQLAKELLIAGAARFLS